MFSGGLIYRIKTGLVFWSVHICFWLFSTSDVAHVFKPVEDISGVGNTGAVIGCVIQIGGNEKILFSETNYVPSVRAIALL